MAEWRGRPCILIVAFDMSLAEYLNGFDPADGLMPLMHSTAASTGASIIVAGELRPTGCQVYGVDLLYLFYGRPAFKPMAGLPPGGMDEHLPMCFVVDPALLDGALRIVPFDSGGYGRYAAHVGPLLSRPDFELGGGRDVPMRLVRALYETNGNYYRQKPTADHSAIPLGQGEARALARLARDAALADDDDRRSTIEVQIDRSVPLAAALKAVVGPPSLFSDPGVIAALSPLAHVPRLPYETYGRQQPSAYTALLYDHVRRYLVDEGVMR